MRSYEATTIEDCQYLCSTGSLLENGTPSCESYTFHVIENFCEIKSSCDFNIAFILEKNSEDQNLFLSGTYACLTAEESDEEDEEPSTRRNFKNQQKRSKKRRDGEESTPEQSMSDYRYSLMMAVKSTIVIFSSTYS